MLSCTHASRTLPAVGKMSKSWDSITCVFSHSATSIRLYRCTDIMCVARTSSVEAVGEKTHLSWQPFGLVFVSRDCLGLVYTIHT